MWRAFFLACGIAMLIVGIEFMVVERVVLAGGKPEATANDGRFVFGQRQAANKKEIVPPDWAPWSLMSAGAIVIIYSFTIPKRVGS